MKKFLLSVLLVSALVLTLTSCGTAQKSSSTEVDLSKDREGTPITLPETIERIITLGPSNTEVVVGLGFGAKIIAADTYSTDIEGMDSSIPLFDMMTPDAEKILELKPDVMYITGMSKATSDDPYKALKDAGVCVIYMPTSKSIEAIKEDIRFYAASLNVKDKGEEMIKNIEKEINAVRKIGDKITEKKSIYFEISPAPYMYSFGSGVFLNEMIELIGAKNSLVDQNEWIAVTDETILDANPDVILTSSSYIENPTEEIKARAGWAELKAVKDNAVYAIDANASSRPSHNIVIALKQMAKAVYPDQYADLK